jgi:hypothetical protein
VGRADAEDVIEQSRSERPADIGILAQRTSQFDSGFRKAGRQWLGFSVRLRQRGGDSPDRAPSASARREPQEQLLLETHAARQQRCKPTGSQGKLGFLGLDALSPRGSQAAQVSLLDQTKRPITDGPEVDRAGRGS